MDGITDPMTLEALACREALSLAMDMGDRSLEVTSDCSGVIEAINA
jgi:ribonuclease HI